MANPADRLAGMAFDPVELRQKVTDLVERERCERLALRDLARAVEELLALAPKDTAVRALADRVLGPHLQRARQLVS